MEKLGRLAQALGIMLQYQGLEQICVYLLTALRSAQPLQVPTTFLVRQMFGLVVILSFRLR